MVLASISVILPKRPSQHSRLTIRKEGIWISCLALNNKTYIFVSSKVLSRSMLSFVTLITSFHQTCLILPNVFLLIQMTRKVMPISIRKGWLWTFYKYWCCINLSSSRTFTKGVFRTQLNIYNKAFLRFSQRYPIIDVLLGSKYASAYIYIRVSLIGFICYMI